MKNFTTLILAGGIGTRLASLYPDLPKPLVPVSGQPFLHWLIQWFKGQNQYDFVVSTGYRGDQIKAWFSKANVMQGTSWQISQEETPLGTGGGVITALPQCKEDLLITNGDSLILASLTAAFTAYNQEGIDGVIIAKPVSDAARFGTLLFDQQKKLTGHKEKQPGGGVISAGIYLLPRRLLKSFPPNKNLSMEYDIIPELIKQGAHIHVQVADEETPFIDIGTPETIREASGFIERHVNSILPR